MHALNQQCNALPMINGIFFHSCNTPDKVIKVLAHSGISVSLTTINRAVHSLSQANGERFRALGQSLLAGYAYDNFNIALHTMTPTVEKSTDNLLHMTSGLAFRLDSRIILADLRCSAKLWEQSPLNPTCAPTLLKRYSFSDVLRLHWEDIDPSQLSRRGRFNAWKFVYDLVHHGPEYFCQFAAELRKPEMVEALPVEKTEFLPARAMDINEARVDGNIEVIEQLFHQGGVGDPSVWERGPDGEPVDIVDISEYVTIFYGDLSTLERIASASRSRAIEDTPWRRLQSVVTAPGIFHLKMAGTDAVWRTFIHPRGSRLDDNSLMHFIGVLRPSEIGKIGSKPSFRQMHEVIGHTGIVLRLDCWRVEVSKRKGGITTLEEFAKSEPSLSELYEYAETLARNYVPGEPSNSASVYERRRGGAGVRDQQLENTRLLHQYLLLYEELTWAMNAGDIGHIETTLPDWIAIFKATGKHKYATQMTKYLIDVHYVYPKGLSNAIRYSILLNPTGKPHHFRAVDWLVELANLFTKDTYGGSGSNYTKDHIITESPNIWLYRACALNAERNYQLSGLTSAHGAKDMARTFADLAAHIEKYQTNKIVPERKSAYSVPDMIQKGLNMIATTTLDTDIDDTMDGVMDEVIEGEGLDEVLDTADLLL